ncbi:hypothetical protein BL253_05585 [Pseudofrankia asymbiotica]|uniref:PAS domain-containing protein n=2 Tax=Pseudofrankia asymbiotica TaxID=1834516 RepID=A0A1V2IGN5_9ACTN|nr:hypothetical protein BL253_05585 [Pseudofrankia asymbiotica]
MDGAGGATDAGTTGWDLFRRMAMSCPLPVFATDAVGRHVFVNPRWCELTGVEPDEAMGWGWERAIHPHDLLAVTNQWGRARSGGDGLWVRLRLLRPDGLHRAAILQAVPTDGEAGAARFIGTLTPLPPLPSSLPTPGQRAGTESVPLPPPLEAPPGPASLASLDVPASGAGPGHQRGGGADSQAEDDGRLRGDDDQAAVQIPVPRPRTGQEPPLPATAGNGTPESACRDDLPSRESDDLPAWDGEDSGDDEAGSAWWDQALNLSGRDDPEPTDLFAAPGERGPGRSRHDHLAWDGNRRRAAAPDGGDSWPGIAETRVAAALGGEWRAAIALHGRATTGHDAQDQAPVTARQHAHDGRHHARAHAQPGGQGRGPIGGGDGERGYPGDHGSRQGGGRGPGMGDGGRGWPDRLPPAECGCLYGELTRAEAACRDRERWLTSLLAELPAAVLLADAHSQVVGVNQAYCDLFDLAEAPVDLVGTDCRLLLRPRTGLVDDPAGFADRLDTLLRRRRTLRRETVMFSDGRVFERSHLPLVSPDGYRGHLWLYVDVTDRRILDAEIEGLISEL